MLSNSFPGIQHPEYIALFILLTLFFLTGLAMNHAGRKLILNFISEAQSWERAGIFQKAERCYLKAVRIYDSFLPSPLFLEKSIGKKLAGAVSGFILSSASNNPLLESSVPGFLKISPGDEDIALFWLKRVYASSLSDTDPEDQELLTLIAEHHNENAKLLPILARIFLQLHRTDFAARKIYKNTLKYTKENSKLKSGINELLSTAEDGTDQPSDVDIQISTPEHFTPKEKKETRLLRGPSVISMLFSAAGSVYSFSVKLVMQAARAAGKGFIRLRSNENVFRYAKRSILAAVLLLVLGFAVNTAIHLFKTEAPKKTVEKIEKQTDPKPFTIQVAAYLDPGHAKNYVRKLRKQGLDVSYSKSEGGGKTWYLVQVSNFSDKKSAAQYGTRLKDKGIIDDFFVDNLE